MSTIDPTWPVSEYAFPGPLRDQLVAALLDGSKTSTSSLLLEYSAKEPLPRAGERAVVVDSAGAPVAVETVTAVEVRRLAAVTLQHALAEGEGFESVDEWRAAHEDFWHSDEFRDSLGDPGFHVTDETEVVCVRMSIQPL
ncbi:ASCH domain-containing protein [Arthrobacter woluwensis]|uniref:ASCH domain-containing protein n=1 Tax=Arthrobacter woluwensis TaxID=156980 RepID=UPI001AAEC2D7|nr:ASCH domain-containing protein [Arthrobacter woluwensis]QTF71072.1 ASCH domain-containing protein [Arthrobacter woluwensis]